MKSLRTGVAFVVGALAGAAAVAIGDPATGRRRRARFRDRSAHRLRQARRGVGRRLRYQQGHLKGIAHDAARTTHLQHEAPLPDYEETLVDKVRSEAFRDSRHELQQINLTAAEGVVHVYGAAHTRREADDILRRVRAVHGVKGTADHLVIREAPPRPPAA